MHHILPARLGCGVGWQVFLLPHLLLPSVLHLVLGSLWLAPAAGQTPIDLRLPRRTKSLQLCPFEAPNLASRNPAEIAWAAYRLTPETARTANAGLCTALESMQKGQSEAHKGALLHLLHAAMQNDITIPMSLLRFEPDGRTRIPWIALQTRAATENGRELFALFHRLDAATDPGWEVLGGSLALRGHGAFAIELRTQMQPVLRVRVGNRNQGATEMKVDPGAPKNLDGFPDMPFYAWERDKYSIVAPTFQPTAGTVCVVDQASTDRARLRWLAALAGENDPVAWAARFWSRFPGRDVAEFDAFARGAEKRATESLAAADATLRQRFKLSERLRLPTLEVVWDDCRSEKEKAAQPMPMRR
ncbi:MAG: hypothetical protein ABIP94_20400 [Planctomycetota bacterium]